MAFKAFLRFGGLCAHVPTRSLDEEEHERLWVVMPDAREPGKDSICEHFPGIFLNAARLASSNKVQDVSSAVSSGIFFWGIERKEITLVPVRADGSEVPKLLTIPKDEDDTDFRYVPNLAQIFPDAAIVDPNFKKDKDSDKLVVARVILEHGTLRALPRSLNAPVHFPDGAAFAVPDDEDQFAHDTVLDLGELASLEIQARDLDTGEVDTLVVAEGTEPCEIGIGNLCADLWLKELGGIEPDYSKDPLAAVDDLDFEAFYYLSSKPLTTNPLGPLPRSKGGGGGPGAKCHQAIFNPFIEEEQDAV